MFDKGELANKTDEWRTIAPEKNSMLGIEDSNSEVKETEVNAELEELIELPREQIAKCRNGENLLEHENTSMLSLQEENDQSPVEIVTTKRKVCVDKPEKGMRSSITKSANRTSNRICNRKSKYNELLEEESEEENIVRRKPKTKITRKFKNKALSLAQKKEILEELEKGKTPTQLGKKYRVSKETISYILKIKDTLLTYLQNSKEEGGKYKLSRNSLPSNILSFSKKLEIIKKLDEGESDIQLGKRYGVSSILIQRIKKEKNKILTYVQNSLEKGEAYKLDLTRSLQPRRILSLSKKAEILKKLGKGKTEKQLSKMYGVCTDTIKNIRNQKDKILTYVQNTIKEGQENNLNRTALPQSKKTSLPFSKKVKILEEIDKGVPKVQLAKKYGVGRVAICNIEEMKDRILSYVKNSKEKRQKDNLKRTSLPPSKRVNLPLFKKVEVLEELDKGDTVKNLSEKYGVNKSTIHDIKRAKDKILAYVQNSKEKGEEDNLNRTALPSSKSNFLPFSKKVEILKKLKEGETHSRLIKEYGISSNAIKYIKRGKDKILTYVKNSIEKGEGNNLSRTRLPYSMPKFVSLSKKVEILEELEKDESQIKQLAKKYGISKSSIKQIKESKDKILTYAQNSRENGEEYKLDQRKVPSCQPVCLPLSKKVEILEELEKGEIQVQLKRKYGICMSAIQNIQKSKDEILKNVQNSIKATEDNNLNGTSLLSSKRVFLPYSKRLKIFEQLEEGWAQTELGKMYKVNVRTIERIRNNKDNVLSTVQDLIEKGKDKLDWTNLPSANPTSLSLSEMIQILEQLEENTSQIELLKKHRDCLQTIECIQTTKDKLLTGLQNSTNIERHDQLNQTPLLRSKEAALSLFQKVMLLEQLEKGETRLELGKKYGVDCQTIHRIQREKDVLLTDVQNSIEEKKDKLNRTMLPSYQEVSLPLSKHVEILEELTEAETQLGLLRNDKFCTQTIQNIQKENEKILCCVRKSMKRDKKLFPTKVIDPKPVSLPLSEVVKTLKEIENDETEIKLRKRHAIENSKEKEKEKLIQTKLPKVKPFSLPLSKTGTSNELKKGKTQFQLREKIGVSLARKVQNLKERGEKVKLRRKLLQEVKILHELENGEPDVRLATNCNVRRGKSCYVRLRKIKMPGKKTDVTNENRKPAGRLSTEHNVHRVKSCYVRIKKIKIPERNKDITNDLAELREDHFNLLPDGRCAFRGETDQCTSINDVTDSSTQPGCKQEDEGFPEPEPRTLNYAKYSKLEIEDWYNNVIKEEHIDISDDETIEEA